MRLHIILVALAILVGVSVRLPAEEPLRPTNGGRVPVSNVEGKKLIRVAQELIYYTSVLEVPEKIVAWQETGFDGLVFSISSHARTSKPEELLKLDNNMVHLWWDTQRRTYEEFRPEIDALKSVKNWGRLTDNFLWVGSSNEGIRSPDWFSDSDWDIVLRNARLSARIAKDAGFKGIFFDGEQYGCRASGTWKMPWDYPLYAKGSFGASGEERPKPFVEVAAKVRQRGKQWAAAMTSVYPDMVLFVIPDLYAIAWSRSQGPEGLVGSDYGLWPAFIDGVLLGLDEKATIVAGGESAYLNSQYRDMLVCRDISKEQSLVVSTVPDLARRRLTFGAGVWTDAGYGATGRFSDTDVRVNQRDPERHKHAVHNALAASDKYAWLWGEWGDHGESNWLTTTPTPLIKEYWRANVDGHKPQDLSWEPEPVVDAADYTQADAESVRKDTEFWIVMEKEGWTVVSSLPDYWKFRFDTEMLVRCSSYNQPNYDDRSWFPIRTISCWQSQGTRSNGPAIYRASFDVPADIDPKKQEIVLAFGGLGSGIGHVYVNGAWIASAAPTIDVAKNIKPGQSNHVTIVYLNKEGPGGLMGHVKLLAR